MKFFWLIISLTGSLMLFSSCQQDSIPSSQELLLGEWYPIEDNTYTDIGLRDYNMQGYRFMEDGFCDYYPGYFEYADPDSGHLLAYPYKNLRYRMEINWLWNIIRPYGTRTFYEIRGDTLQTFNLSSKMWDQQIVRFLSSDTLVLSSLDSTQYNKYIRKEYLLNDQPLFDQLIFYYPHIGFPETHFFSIHRDGTLLYCYHYINQNNVFTGKLKEGTFEEIETLFKKADLPHVIAEADNWYQKNKSGPRVPFLPSAPLLYESYITFISDNKSFTMIDPFHEVSFDNKAFFWAYIYGLFLPQTAQFEPGTLEKQWPYFPYFKSFFDLKITKPDSIVDLFHTEKFYLSILLAQADTTDKNFDPIYTLKESYSSKKKYANRWPVFQLYR